jgi:predicted Zn-dependent protease with MMP-like domain
MEKREFERLVLRAIEELPEKFRKKLENIEIIVEDEPQATTLSKCKISPLATLLGLYQGVPLRKRGPWYGNILPDKVTIYQKNIESLCRSREEIEKRVCEVVQHEIGHYFGLKEEELK